MGPPSEAILIANGFAVDQDATRVSINVTNTLAAVSESGTSALIDKNDVGTLVIQAEGCASASQQAVPEPGTLALIGGV